MFDLEPAIAEWRRQMLAAGIKAPVPQEELEAHLRDEIEAPAKSGLSPAAAFEAAVRKIGAAPAIQDEFRKVGAAREDRRWKFLRVVLAVAMSATPIFMIGMTFESALFPGFAGPGAMTPAERISGCAAAGVFVLLAGVTRLSCRLLPDIPTKRIKEAMHWLGGGLLALWWIAFLNLVTPHYDFASMGQLAVAILWGYFTPAGAWTGWYWGVETAARRKIAPARS